MAWNVPSADYNVEFNQGAIKTAISENKATARDLLMIPIDRLTAPAGFNVRIHDEAYEDHVEEIKESIIANGFYSVFPLKVYVNKEGDQNLFLIVGGFTRFEAAKRAIAQGAPIEKLPCVAVPPGTSMGDLMVQLDRDNAANRLRPYERAVAAKRATGYGKTEDEIAAGFGCTKKYVQDMLYAMGLPTAVQTMMVNGQCTLSLAVATCRKNGVAEGVKALAAAIAEAEADESDADADTDEKPATGRRGNAEALAKARAARATAGSVSRAGGGFKPNVKSLTAAIMYAIELPTGDQGIEWLNKWIKGDTEALKELKSATRAAKKGEAPPPAGPTKKAQTAAEKKAAEKKKKDAAKKAAAAAAKKPQGTGSTAKAPEQPAENTPSSEPQTPPERELTDDDPL